jgi:uncharacterized protein YbjT (DUF2867 family)
VLGATGAQGGSVARHLLASGQYVVRAMTRTPDSDKARVLRLGGAEVVPGDLTEPSTLRAALAGVQIVFGVTDFWEHFAAEYAQGVALADAVAAADVEHFVFSSLPHVEQLTQGELRVPHFDMKARIETYVRGLGIPATFLHVAFYYENFLTSATPQRQPDGTYVFGFPQGDTPLAAVAVEDVGGVVAGVLKRRSEFLGKTIGVVGDDLPAHEYAAIMTRVLGRSVAYRHIPRDVFESFGFPGAEELAAMFEFNRRFIPDRRDDLQRSRELYPGMQTFEGWVIAQRGVFGRVLAL